MKDIIAAAVVLGSLASPAAAEGNTAVSVLRAGTRVQTFGPPENFTGTVRVDSRFKGSDPARISGGTVSFEAGARTAWHAHPLSQTLFVTSGVGRVQHWDGEVQEIRPGDIVWIPPGVKHWHGASPTAGMVHLAFSEAQDGKSVDWLEQVTDAQYRK